MQRSRQLAAIMFTDIKGYTALMQQNEAKAVDTRNKHRRIFNQITEKHHGKILQYYGDGTLSIFGSAIAAVQCGIEMQRGFRETPAIPVRIGIHSGDILLDEEDIIGDSVNVASRIESLAEAGSVLISDKVYDEVKNQESIRATHLRAYKFKNVARPIDIYAIANQGLVVPAPGQVTSGSILATKLFIPPPRQALVQRQRLQEKLRAGLPGKLTLVSAPAGFGKTTLLSQWIAESDRPVAWLSLDPSDADPNRFLRYILAAVQTIIPQVGYGLSELLDSSQPPSAESILTRLLNQVAELAEPFVLVLDDYHTLDAKPADELLTFLLDHLPRQVHLVISSREDPSLPLARLRVRGQLTEIRARDLRFSAEEATDFLNEAMELDLPVSAIVALEKRTEGWIAGLQMAALSMQGRMDVMEFIEAFTGSHRFVLDYLAEEVLQRQPAAIRQFMLETSVPERLSSSLCDHLTQGTASNHILDTLDRNNLFLVPLDDRREWYRYHHLFRDVLRARAIRDLAGQLPSLHLRASEWFGAHQLPVEAITHAFSANATDRAAELLEMHWPDLRLVYQEEAFRKWVEQLPETTTFDRPVLGIYCAFAYLFTDPVKADFYLDRVTPWLEAGTGETPNPQIFNRTEWDALPGIVAIARGYRAGTRGDIDNVIKYGSQAIDLLPSSHQLWRGSALALVGIAQWTSGNLQAAQQSVAKSIPALEADNGIGASISASFVLAEIKMAQGLLKTAEDICRKNLQRAEDAGLPGLEGTGALQVVLGELAYERGALNTAGQHLQQAQALGKHAMLSEVQHRPYTALACIQASQGKTTEALKLLEVAERHFQQSPAPNLRPIPAVRARIFLRSGQSGEALNWLAGCRLSLNDEPAYLREFEHLTLARIQMALYREDPEANPLNTIIPFLERLLQAARNGGRIGSIIEILILQALAHQLLNQPDQAGEALEDAVLHAQPEGFITVFTNEGEPMVALLKALRPQSSHAGYINRVLAAMAPDKISSLPEALSRRELEVLKLIADGFSNKEISDQLFLALSTIKGHNRKIFDKLDVQRRTEAVARARELGLV